MGEDHLTSRELLEDPKIPPIAKAIFALLDAHPEGLTKNQISFYLGLCDRTVERNLTKLPWVAVHSKYCAGGRGRHNLYYIPTNQRLQRDPSMDWSGIERTVDPVRMADMKAPGPEELAELMRKAASHPVVQATVAAACDPAKTSTLESDSRVGGEESPPETSTLESDARVGPQRRTLESVSEVGQLEDPLLDFTDGFMEEMLEATRTSEPEPRVKTPPPQKRSKTDELIRRNSGNPISFRALSSSSPAGSPDLFPFLLPKEEGMETSKEEISNLRREENKYNNIKYSARERARVRVGARGRDPHNQETEYGDQPGPRWAYSIIESWMYPAGREPGACAGSAWEEVIDALSGSTPAGQRGRVAEPRGHGDDQRLHRPSQHARDRGPATRQPVDLRHPDDRGPGRDRHPCRGDDPNPVRDVGLEDGVPRPRGGLDVDTNPSRSVRSSTTIAPAGIRDRLGRSEADGGEPHHAGRLDRGLRAGRDDPREGAASDHRGVRRPPSQRAHQKTDPVRLGPVGQAHEAVQLDPELALGADGGEADDDRRPDHPTDGRGDAGRSATAEKTEDRKAGRSMATRRLTERQKRINKAKELAQKKAEGKKLKGKLDPALLMAYAFEEALADYHYRPTMKFIKNRQLDPSKKSTQYFAQAARLATAAGADFGDFVRAQFYWFHIWFGRDCRTHELRSKKGTFSAIERYRQYIKLREEGKVPTKVTATSVGLVDTSDQEVDKINDGRLERLSELWDMTAEATLIAFVPEGIFDQDWLERNAIYNRLKMEGRL